MTRCATGWIPSDVLENEPRTLDDIDLDNLTNDDIYVNRHVHTNKHRTREQNSFFFPNNNSSRAPSHVGRSVGPEPLSFQISLLVFLARCLQTLWQIQKALVPTCMGATSLVDPAAAVLEV